MNKFKNPGVYRPVKSVQEIEFVQAIKTNPKAHTWTSYERFHKERHNVPQAVDTILNLNPKFDPSLN